jgi:hypothetical protein
VRRAIEQYRNIGVGYLVCGWLSAKLKRAAELALGHARLRRLTPRLANPDLGKPCDSP